MKQESAGAISPADFFFAPAGWPGVFFAYVAAGPGVSW
jgi:hypothetical protein